SIFLFPWATVFAAPGYGATTLVEMFIFLAEAGSAGEPGVGGDTGEPRPVARRRPGRSGHPGRST
ncbi:NADH-quinone oxidoreductase subunit A, partial [Streptomyces sp. NPDC005209]|uniref:NADH-quinone oxidoreductase subunit A n=1 Tax=Streptomyces sp. NPDC005209 TaxID=3156715 RepID=UPI0033A1013B